MFFKKKSNIQTENDLLAEYRSTGDQDLLGRLFEPQMEWVFSVCIGYLKTKQDAEDALIHIYEKIGVELRKHEVANFKSWLHSLTRNHCLMILRKKKPQTIPLDEVFSLPSMDSEFGLHQEDELKKLEGCIGQLKKEQKSIISMFYKEEMCYLEISEELSLEIKKVKSALQNGRRMLKLCMKKH